MADPTSTGAVMVTEAFQTAQALLRQAEADARALRAEADRYVRQREQEAELLVGKARRLLAVAEDEAAGMIAAAGLASADVRVDLDRAAEEPQVIPLRREPTALDGILAAAIAKAVDRSFPSAV